MAKFQNIATPEATRRKKKKKEEFMSDLFERFDKINNRDLFNIPKTGPNVKTISTFEKFRPKKGHVLDYDISQTSLKIDAGITAIKLRRTVGKYVPVSPEDLPKEDPIAHMVLSHAGKPCWEYLDEKLKRKIEIQQAIYREELAKRIKLRKETSAVTKRWAHDRLVKMAGPEWFQELSPTQIKAIEELKASMEKDNSLKTISNTVDAVGQLGLVLRPNQRHIVKAFELSNRCPIEFLLVLYQLMRPQRTEYNINDRLLLSSVAHLTLTDTLRELHVRIPSPPRKRKKTAQPIKVKKQRIRYSSPYLIPYTFEKPKRKHTGIYKMKHNQYPESPYFSYITSMKNDITTKVSRRYLFTKNKKTLEPIEEELINELKLAQITYNKEHKTTRVMLLKPKVYQSCSKMDKEIVYTLNATDQKENRSQTDRRMKTSKDDVEPIDVGRLAKCLNDCINTSVMDQTCPEICNCNVNPTCQNIAPEQCKCSSTCTQTIGVVKSCEMPIVSLPECTCIHENKPQRTNETGVRPLYEDPPDFVPKKDDDLPPVPKVPSHPFATICECRETIRNTLATNICDCEECQADRLKNTTYLISTTKESESGQDLVPVIGGAVVERTCSCMRLFQEKLRKMEEYRMRLEARQKLKMQQYEYQIGGVINTDQGPVYQISGMKPPKDCECGKRIRDAAEEKGRIERLPKIPEGLRKYVIQGVKQSPEGDQFVLGEALPVEDCKCMTMFYDYIEQHQDCLDTYNNFLKKIEDDLREYYEDLKEECEEEQQLEQYDEGIEMKEDNECIDGEQYNVCTNDGDNKIIEQKPEVKPQQEQQLREQRLLEQQPPQEQIAEIQVKEPDDKPPKKRSTIKPVADGVQAEYKLKEESSKTDGKLKKLTPERSKTGIKKSALQLPEVDFEALESEDLGNVELKRYQIFKKFPKDPKNQRHVLKAALKQMAEDGYPLAKLPDVHKLPIFKLWILLRSKVFWKVEAALEYNKKIIAHSKHITSCSFVPNSPKLGMSIREASALTWRDSKKVKEFTSNAISKFTNKVLSAQVDYGREFYPVLYNYEFPFADFRQCFAAYTPFKLEDSMPRFVWNYTEVKNFNKRVSCLCRK